MTSPNTIISDLVAGLAHESDIAESYKEQRDELIAEVESLKAQQWIIALGAAELAIEKCKNATGQRRTIDLYVSPNQCTEDVLEAISKAKGSS